MKRVLVVDDQTLVRQGIRSLLDLTPDLRVTGDARDGDEALAALSSGEYDAVLLDVRMPRRGGLEVLRRLLGAPHPPVILLTTFDDDSVALEGIRLGAQGFLLKDVTLEELSLAVREVIAGRTLFRPSISERLRDGLEAIPTTFESSPLPDPLTPREREILRLLASGSSNREIAHALGTAEGTVKNQVSAILSKLGVRDRTRAVLKGIELGYV